MTARGDHFSLLASTRKYYFHAKILILFSPLLTLLLNKYHAGTVVNIGKFDQNE